MVSFVGAGPGDIELITVKGMKKLEKADCVIYAGSLVNKKLLEYCRDGVESFDSAGMSLEEVILVMTACHHKGKQVVRLHTGDPSLYGAIREQMDRLEEIGIPYEVIPGVSSFTAAAASLKEELTIPGVSQTVIITRLPGKTGQGEGGQLEELARHRASMCIFLSVQEIDKVAEKLMEGYPPSTPAAVVYKATWGDEKIIRGTLETIGQQAKEAGIYRFAQILVGDFMGEGYNRSKLYAPDFTHMYREGSR